MKKEPLRIEYKPNLRPLSSIDFITQWTREERFLINQYRMKMLDKMESLSNVSKFNR
jgi:hypothetical protein